MQGQKTSPPPAVDRKARVQRDLDFSFLEISDITELSQEGNPPEPREVGLKKEKPKKNEDGKFDTKVVRINDNNLEDMKELFSTLELIVLNPAEITWIDLSINRLTAIDECLCDLPSLQILYLHGNCIAKLNEVDKLAGIPNLKKLSLHGNPVASDKFYKPYVLTRITQLRCFDMAVITKADRATCNTLSSMTQQKKSRKPKPE